MKNHNGPNELAPEEYCEFMEGISDADLNWLIGSPLLGIDLLEHAALCAKCGGRIEEAEARECGNVSPDETEIEQNVLPLAAHALGASPAAEDGDTKPLFVVGNLPFDVDEDDEGRLYLLGPVPANVTRISFGIETFPLGAISDSVGRREIEGVGMTQLQEVVRRCEKDPVAHPITFA